jgi:hypothetical protein
MKNNQEVQRDRQNSVRWMHKLHVLELVLKEKNGLVLTKLHQSLETNALKSSNFKQFSDAEIEMEVLAALHANRSIPTDNITVKVDKGWVTLNGDLPFNYQREATKSAVKNLSGVKCLTINIKTKSYMNPASSKFADLAAPIFY